MRIAVVKPNSHFLQHRVRGIGTYISNLESSLKKYDKDNTYISCAYDKIPNDIDIVHYPYFEPFFLSLPFFKNKKMVVTVHDLIPLVFPKEFPMGIKGFLKWQLQKKLLKKADMVITDSMSSKKDIVRFANIKEDRIRKIYLAPSERFRKLNKVENKYNLPKKFVLYVGDVTWNKNLPRLVEAVLKLDIPMVMVGKALTKGSYDKNNSWNKDLLKVSNMIEGERKIKKLGFVSEEDLVALYNMATVFTMPSLYEGFGLPILEAMSCGCPVVTSDKGSIGEIAGDAPIYVDPYDINDISNGINKVFFDEKLQKELSKKGLEQSEKFSWKKTVDQTIDVYKTII